MDIDKLKKEAAEKGRILSGVAHSSRVRSVMWALKK